MGTANHIKFPDNIFEAENIEVDGEVYRLLKARFSNLYELYDFLKSDPEINTDIFKHLESVYGHESFAGKPYREAVEDLIGETDSGYDEFLELQNDLNVKKGTVHKYNVVRTVVGGRVHIPSFSAGSPYCFETEELVKKPKFVRLHVNLSYFGYTTKKQVLNRAIIITNIIRALERAGYNVDVNAFSMSRCYDEIAYVIIQIKRHGGRLDMQAIYKTLCRVEFLRRITFRIRETMDFRNDWQTGYGSTCDEYFVRTLLQLSKTDIFFDQPQNMGIFGNDLASDFEHAIDHLNLQDKIDVERAKAEFSKTSKILTMKEKNKNC